VKLVLVNSIRQSGKSTLLFLIMLYHLFNRQRFQAAVIASSKDTVKSIFRQKVSDVVNRSPKLRADARILNESISVPRLMSHAELYPSEAVGGLIGRSLNMLLLDECCLIPDESIAAALPSVMAQEDGKVIAISSSWAPSGWFYESVVAAEKVGKKDPSVFLFRSDSRELNPAASQENLDAMSKMLIRINPAYEKRFLSTEFAELGNEFLPRQVVDACIDYQLVNAATSKLPCYAFLDLSLKRDLTSRVVVAYDRQKGQDKYTVQNINILDPKGFINRRVDFNAVKAMIEADHKSFSIRKYLVDERAEAGELLQWARERGFYLEPFNATVDRNMAIWGRLMELLSTQKLSIPFNRRLLSELYNLRVEEFSFGRSFRITDASRKLHRDVSMALAGAAWAASEHRAVEPRIVWLGGDERPERRWIDASDFFNGAASLF
jgi:phage terminase large subunit-like protein